VTVLSRDLFSVLSGWCLYNKYLFKVKSECVESSGELKAIERLMPKTYKRSEFSVVKSVISQQSKLKPGVQESTGGWSAKTLCVR
jgi:hypothetical protein